jgi:hypothetical protein
MHLLCSQVYHGLDSNLIRYAASIGESGIV